MKVFGVFIKCIAVAVFFSASCELVTENNCKEMTTFIVCSNTTLTPSFMVNNDITSFTLVNCFAPHLLSKAVNFYHLKNIHIHSSDLNDSVSEMALENLKKMVLFEISYSSVTELPLKLFYHNSALVKVNLVGNKLKNIAPNTFINNDKLSSLNLSRNMIDSFNGSALNTKNCGNSNVVGLTLDLSHNNLTKLKFINCVKFINIIHLDISNNRIMSLERDSMDKLVTLKNISLAHNKLQTIAPEALTSMRELLRLDLRHNNLRGISRNVFKGADALVELLLDWNEIQCIDPSALQDLKSLMVLGLQGNLLIQLDLKELPENFHHSLTSDFLYCSKERLLLNSTVLSEDCKENVSRIEDTADLCKCEVDERYKKKTEIDECQSSHSNRSNLSLNMFFYICFLLFIIIYL